MPKTVLPKLSLGRSLPTQLPLCVPITTTVRGFHTTVAARSIFASIKEWNKKRIIAAYAQECAEVLADFTRLANDYERLDQAMRLVEIVPGFGDRVTQKALEQFDVLVKNFSGSYFLGNLAGKIPGFGE
jgi:hypothetical protein